MKICLIEDNALKAAHIQAYLESSIENLQLSIYGSFQSGLKGVEGSANCIVLLDMTLPNFDRNPLSREGRIRPLGGYDLMRKLKLHKVAAKIIVLTQFESFGEGDGEITFEELSEQCKKEFPNLFLGSIRFSQNNNQWQSELDGLLMKIKSHDD